MHIHIFITHIHTKGNKCDVEESRRKISTEEAQEMAQSMDIPFMETSAKTKFNVDEAFRELVKLVRKHKGIDVTKTKKKKNGCTLL